MDERPKEFQSIDLNEINKVVPFDPGSVADTLMQMAIFGELDDYPNFDAQPHLSSAYKQMIESEAVSKAIDKLSKRSASYYLDRIDRIEREVEQPVKTLKDFDSEFRQDSMDLLYQLEIGKLTSDNYIMRMKRLSFDFNRKVLSIVKEQMNDK